MRILDDGNGGTGSGGGGGIWSGRGGGDGGGFGGVSAPGCSMNASSPKLCGGNSTISVANRSGFFRTSFGGAAPERRRFSKTKSQISKSSGRRNGMRNSAGRRAAIAPSKLPRSTFVATRTAPILSSVAVVTSRPFFVRRASADLLLRTIFDRASVPVVFALRPGFLRGIANASVCGEVPPRMQTRVFCVKHKTFGSRKRGYSRAGPAYVS